MSERAEEIRDLEQRVLEREKHVGKIAERMGEHVGPGTTVHCHSCGKNYRLVGGGHETVPCPYCGLGS
jgi:hypothetical protein